MKQGAVNALIITGSILAALLIAELAVRLILPQNKMVTWIEMHPRGFMMNQQGGTAFQEFGERRADYRFTSHRTRGFEPEQQKENILTIGDSFTFGLLLNEEYTYVSEIEKRIQSSGNDSVQVLNAAVGGAGLADWPAWIEEFGEDLSPAKIVWFLHTADVERALSKNLYVINSSGELEPSIRWQPREFFFSLGRKGWYRWLQSKSELMNGIVTFLWQNAYFNDITNNFDPERSDAVIPGPDSFSIESEYSLTLSMLLVQKVSDWCRENDCDLILTTTGFFPSPQEGEHTWRFYRQLADGEIPDITFYDNTPCVMDQAGGDLDSIRIPGDSHPSEEGAAIIADCTWDWLHKYFD